MTKTKSLVLVSVLVFVLVAAVVAVKIIFFPSVKDAYFAINDRSLQRVPPGLVVVRPTHFPGWPKQSSSSGMMQTDVKGAMWMVGRNVTFQQLIAIAYGYNPGRIVVPPNPRKVNFDYLVTVPNDPETHLQMAIKKKLGFTAQKETRDTDVLAL